MLKSNDLSHSLNWFVGITMSEHSKHSSFQAGNITSATSNEHEQND